jgi:hypothetical protein
LKIIPQKRPFNEIKAGLECPHFLRRNARIHEIVISSSKPRFPFTVRFLFCKFMSTSSIPVSRCSHRNRFAHLASRRTSRTAPTELQAIAMPHRSFRASCPPRVCAPLLAPRPHSQLMNCLSSNRGTAGRRR